MGYGGEVRVNKSFCVHFPPGQLEESRETIAHLVRKLVCQGVGATGLERIDPSPQHPGTLTLLAQGASSPCDAEIHVQLDSFCFQTALNELAGQGLIEIVQPGPACDINASYEGVLHADADLFREPPLLDAPVLLGAYRGYNLVHDTGRRDGRIFAFPHALGEDALLRYESEMRSREDRPSSVIVAQTLELATTMIDLALLSDETRSDLSGLNAHMEDQIKIILHRLHGLEGHIQRLDRDVRAFIDSASQAHHNTLHRVMSLEQTHEALKQSVESTNSTHAERLARLEDVTAVLKKLVRLFGGKPAR